ncbi:amino acid/amide ABC transporter substrate-binding protein (HAAT family) [Homoserinimonas aerilata]|uniref:Amino acid/amide ABC transporter substrate-binding protein (HAAT family) n=1 Tax=Homoserinimonas aerilata TaxID=1162970 RepID=A0A542YLB3_9MICO|nr:ABC transporter substrate-binding protein [Homoserinimonas aerilata]TQL48886.1 amino acid/amide ABC transporter substrate-binding protein (HAAT family) [Homoserinimonas aerilata]
MSVFARGKASRSLTRKATLGGLAVLGVSALILSGCASTDEGTGGNGAESPSASDALDIASGERDLTLKIGTLLPQTGGLAFLGPPEEAGVALAAKEINEAGLGIQVEVVYGDSGDPDNKAYATTVPNLLGQNVSAIIGAAASGVSKLVIDQITAAGVVQFSPANTSPDFTSWDDNNLYWRTAPSDLLQGEVLGNLIADDGASTLGMIVLNDAYGTGLQKVTKETFEAAGGTVVAEEMFNTGDTNFSAQVSAVVAEDPDAIALITFDEIYTIAPELANAGFDMSKVYLVDGNLKQFGDDLPAGTITGAKGTTPGPVLEDDFEQRLSDVYQSPVLGGTEPLSDFSYAAESYDAVILLALAAYAANSVEGTDIAKYLRQVSGGTGDGEKATDFKSAATILADGAQVDYDGYSGGVKFDEHGDPTEATIGIFQYGEDNLHKRIN